MARDFAKKLYNSCAWKVTRAAYIAKVFGLCERCSNPGYIVHHKLYLTPKNINDPSVTLNHENLEYLCLDCHNNEHMGSSEPVTAAGTAFDEYGNLIQIGEGFKRELR